MSGPEALFGLLECNSFSTPYSLTKQSSNWGQESPSGSGTRLSLTSLVYIPIDIVGSGYPPCLLGH